MVHMAHDSHNRRTRHQVFLLILFDSDGFAHLGADIFCRESELFGHDIYGLGVQTLVDAYHQSKAHACADYLGHRHLHEVCQVVGRHEFSDLDYLAFGCFAFCLALFAVMSFFAFLFTPFNTLLGSLVGKACQSLLHLLLHIFVRQRCCRFGRVALSLASFGCILAGGLLLVVLSAVASLSALSFRTASVKSGLRCGLFHIYLFLAYTFAFLAVGIRASLCAGCSAAVTVFLAALARTRTLVKGGEIDRADHLELRGLYCGRGAEYLRLVLSLRFVLCRFFSFSRFFNRFWRCLRLGFHLFGLVFGFRFWLVRHGTCFFRRLRGFGFGGRRWCGRFFRNRLHCRFLYRF